MTESGRRKPFGGPFYAACIPRHSHYNYPFAKLPVRCVRWGYRPSLGAVAGIRISERLADVSGM